ncbi:MAG: hypothetical protein GU356_03270 [Pyrobaculum sp.]|jgi:hypothetical protein|nr:hypothetical protein [Pyrobaculum sp.]
MEMWRRHGEAASAGLSAALYSVYSDLYSEAVVSSVASALALAVVGRFREAVEYVRKAAKALYEAAKDVFEHVKITVQRLVELFVEAVTRVLAWIDEHRTYLFLMAAVAAGVVALSAALNLWGMIELDKLAYAASLAPFIPAGVKEYSREEVFNILKNDPDPYEKFKKIAKDANAGRVKLAEPWESLRMLIAPRSSEERELRVGRGAELYGRYAADEKMKRALFYAALALEEAFSVYRTALEEYAKGLREAVQRGEVGDGPYVADLKQIKQLAEEEEAAFTDALSTLREKLNEYAVRHGLGDLLDVKEDVARRLAEATAPELSRFSGVNFGVKAYAALIAYREYALGRRGVFGTAARYWLEVGGSAWHLYYPPKTAYDRAKKEGVVRPAEVGEMLAEGLRRLFLKPGTDHYSDFIKELEKGGKLALELEKETESSYVFKLYNMKEGGKLDELGISLWIAKMGKGEVAGITYTLIFDMERWWGFFEQRLEVVEKAAEEVRRRLPVEDLFMYAAGWVDSDVAIIRKKNKRVLRMTTSRLWQFAETHALFGWSVVGLRMTLTLEGPKLVVLAEAPLEKLDEAIKRSAEGGWLHMLGVEAGSWDVLKRWVADHWGEVTSMVKRRLESVKVGLGFDLGKALEELEGLKSKLDDDKVAREVIAPALLLMQAERLGVDETTLRYLGAVVSSAIDGDGYVSAAMKRVELTSGERVIALLWGAALAAHGIETEVKRVWSAFNVVASGVGAARLAGLYFRYGPPLLEGDDRLKNHKLDEAMKLAAEGLDVSWEGLRRRTEGGPVAADLTISEGGFRGVHSPEGEGGGQRRLRKSQRDREGGKERGSLKLKGFEMEVEVNGEKYKVKVRGGEAVEEDRGGKKLLRIKITAEVGGVRRNYEITYGRYGKDNAAVGRAYASAKAPGGREADAERFTAVIKAITGKEPKVYQRSDGKIEIVCGREHLDGFARYAELADAIERWLEETGRR